MGMIMGFLCILWQIQSLISSFGEIHVNQLCSAGEFRSSIDSYYNFMSELYVQPSGIHGSHYISTTDDYSLVVQSHTDCSGSCQQEIS
jgi:hypothetical protein